MSKSIEIEYKSLLSEDDFLRLCQVFPADKKITQINHYFDTADFEIKEKKMGLRIREFPNGAEATLKMPLAVGLLEITDTFSLEIAKKAVAESVFPDCPDIQKELDKLGIAVSDLKLFGSLKTIRHERKIEQGLLALDESWYLDTHDFEIELEVESGEFTLEMFKDFLKENNTTYALAKKKITRLFDSAFPNN